MADTPQEIPLDPKARPRSLSARHKTSQGIWAFRLIVLPPLLLGLYFLLFAIPARLIWAIFGDDHTARVNRIWIDRNSKRLQCHAAFTYDLATGPRSTDKVIPGEMYNRLDSDSPENRTVRVHAISVGPIFYDDVIDLPGGVWKNISGVCLFGVVWCSILGVILHRFYFRPDRKRKRKSPRRQR